MSQSKTIIANTGGVFVAHASVYKKIGIPTALLMRLASDLAIEHLHDHPTRYVQELYRLILATEWAQDLDWYRRLVDYIAVPDNDPYHTRDAWLIDLLLVLQLHFQQFFSRAQCYFGQGCDPRHISIQYDQLYGKDALFVVTTGQPFLSHTAAK